MIAHSLLGLWRSRLTQLPLYGSRHTVCLGFLRSVNILDPVSQTGTNMRYFIKYCVRLSYTGAGKETSPRRRIYTGRAVSVLLKCNQGILVRITVPEMKHHIQSNLKRKGLIWLTLPWYASSPKEDRRGMQQGRNLEAGAMELCCLLAYYSLLSQPAFS